MLAPNQQELIAAAVDGELSAEEKRAAKLLLETSPEALALYKQLKADRNRVRALPQQQPPASLAARFMARVAAVPARPAQPAPSRDRKRISVFAFVALAASLFIAVTVASFAYNNERGANGGAAKVGPWVRELPANHDAPPAAVPSPTDSAPIEPVKLDPFAVAHADVSPVPRVIESPLTASVAVAPTPRPLVSDFNAAPLLTHLKPFDLIQARVPFLRPVAELTREDTRQELTEELARDPAFRFDLFVRDVARGTDAFRNAAKTAGLNVYTDAGTLERLKKRQSNSVVIYTDSLSASELADLFDALVTQDAKFSPRVCDSLHAVPVSRTDETELKAVLGFDVGVFKRPLGTKAGQGGKSGAKSVSAGTIDEVTKALTTPSAEKCAVLVTWNGLRTPPAMSAELKTYLAKRGDRKPNAVPALIVIRTAN
jgi:anti-sigma factor RsiW